MYSMCRHGCYLHSKELVLLSLTLRLHEHIRNTTILTNESCASDIWSLETDILGILDADLLANNAEGRSVTTSLRIILISHLFRLPLLVARWGQLSQAYSQYSRKRNISFLTLEAIPSSPLCLPLVLIFTNVVSVINPLYRFAMTLVAPFCFGIHEF